MKKAFISILGTNDYLECRHSFGNITTDTPVKYCQEDIIKIFCKDFEEDSEIRIFLTDKAKRTNWLDNGHIDRKTNLPIPNKGLQTRLNEMHLNCKIKSIEIKEGYSEEEIWEVFQIIFDSFREEEEIVVDITHSFRSLPMLMITLLNFAKQIKKIKISGIYYAAFEALGELDAVKKIPADNRVAPILNLTSFADLQDWTNATFDFINNANATRLKELIKISAKKSTIEKPAERFFPSKVINQLDHLINAIGLCRGNELINFPFDELKINLASLKSKDLPRAFIYLVDEIENKISNFNNNINSLTITTVDWCLSHGLYQQAITHLQEFTISLVANDCNLNLNEKNHRDLISQAFRIFSQNIPEEDWKEPASINKALIKEILNNKILRNLANVYNSLTDLRNDVNHAGFLNKAKSVDAIRDRLSNIFNSYREILL